ncbi:cardiolipin synthase [Pontibacillus yanchengensis]|uniref:Cardiolipin synthase n=1 Tax=Pontibacillus yanchengensis TaxID=462910 RepID=A0ACC7VKV0_9BACI|nr:cardiolipin synthase [Pontibacillus yanchengensis]MYL54579.1 cardiolipin synthase [Pontibacillus yanchengensis]
MYALIVIISIIFFISCLLFLDYQLGKRNHIKNLRFLDFEPTTGDYNLYTNGDQLFTDLFDDLRHAKKQINVMFFIVKDDDISHELLELLKKKAQEGLRVRLMVDRIGSFRINKATVKQLEQAGIEFTFSSTPKFPFLYYRIQRRNHRKITIIDDEIGYVGGFNMGQEYLGRDAELGNWRDYHLRLIGDVVKDLQITFFDDWYLNTGESYDHIPEPTSEGSKEVEITSTDGGQLEDVFMTLIQQAQDEIFIGTPYFIPSERLMKALLSAMDRGVDVKVIVPMKADHLFVKEAGLPYLSRVRKAGGEVYFFDLGFYHAKVIIIDQELCDIGTANFDRRSLFLNKEVNTLIFNKRFVMDLRLAYLRDVQDSQPFDDHYTQLFNLGTKIRIGLAYLVRPLL